MYYNHYKQARDKAWEILVKTKINVLPIDLKGILKYYNIDIFLLNDSNKDFEDFVMENKIYLNSRLAKTRARFTIAHELGHILLNHKDLTHTVHNDIGLEEFQANIFARGLLMPASVLKEINCINAEDIANMCNVSMQTAEHRSRRLKELITRDKFYLHPLERKVINNFKEFCSSIKFNKK